MCRHRHGQYVDYYIIVQSATKFPANMSVDRVNLKDDFVESPLKFIYTIRKLCVRFGYL